MKKLILFFVITVSNLFSQSNNPAPYCLPTSSLGCGQAYISSVQSVGGATNTSNSQWSGPGPCFYQWSNGYIYYCNKFISVNAGQTITMTLQSQIGNQSGFAAFVDWNQDNLFSSPGETVAVLPNWIGFSYSFMFTVPLGQPNGKYRLRMRLERFINGNLIDPCAAYGEGESEDYDIYVGAPSNVNVAVASPSWICQGNSSTLSVSGPGTFTWSNGVTGSLTVVSPTASTYYSVAISSNTCPMLVNVAVTPSMPVIASSSPSVSCAGETVTLSATGLNTFTWSTGAIGNWTSVSPTVTTTYSVVASGGACTGTASVTQIVQANPTITASSSSASICSGNTVTLSASGTPFYLWSNGSSSSSITVAPAVTTAYTVTGISGICTASAIVIQSVVSTPTVGGISSSSVLCSGDAATLTASGASNYSWMPSGSGNSIVITPSTTTTYTIIGSNGPCTSSASITQSVVICNLLNEHFWYSKLQIFPVPFTNELSVISKRFVSVFIFNSKGQLVVQSEGNGTIFFNTSQWDQGIYFLRTIDSIESKNHKLIKN